MSSSSDPSPEIDPLTAPFDEPFDLARVRPIPIADRTNKVTRSMFRPLADPHGDIAAFLDSLPALLAADQLRAAARAVVDSVNSGRPVFVAMGGHVVKVGMGPVLIDLMRRGFIRALVMNGSTAIHDYEIATIGETSEHVEVNVADGTFGMAHETAVGFGTAADNAERDGHGLGRALGELLIEQGAPYASDSMLAEAARLNVPVTVHVAIGTDVVHMHPQLRGAPLGHATHYDFRLLAQLVCDLDDGCWINVGSAVLLPEVFLKVVNLARNVGNALDGITAINFDMLQHYRTSVNVLERPVARGISVIGHHEINLPLFRVATLIEWERRAAATDSAPEG